VIFSRHRSTSVHLDRNILKNECAAFNMSVGRKNSAFASHFSLRSSAIPHPVDYRDAVRYAMSGRFRMIAVGAALTLIIGHGDLAAQSGPPLRAGITAPAAD
jgi:hypothetical protein